MNKQYMNKQYINYYLGHGRGAELEPRRLRTISTILLLLLLLLLILAITTVTIIMLLLIWHYIVHCMNMCAYFNVEIWKIKLHVKQDEWNCIFTRAFDAL